MAFKAKSPQGKLNEVASAFEKASASPKPKPLASKKGGKACPTCGQVKEPGEGSPAEELKDASE